MYSTNIFYCIKSTLPCYAYATEYGHTPHAAVIITS